MFYGIVYFQTNSVICLREYRLSKQYEQVKCEIYDSYLSYFSNSCNYIKGSKVKFLAKHFPHFSGETKREDAFQLCKKAYQTQKNIGMII